MGKQKSLLGTGYLTTRHGKIPFDNLPTIYYYCGLDKLHNLKAIQNSILMLWNYSSPLNVTVQKEIVSPSDWVKLWVESRNNRKDPGQFVVQEVVIVVSDGEGVEGEPRKYGSILVNYCEHVTDIKLKKENTKCTGKNGIRLFAM